MQNLARNISIFGGFSHAAEIPKFRLNKRMCTILQIKMERKVEAVRPQMNKAAPDDV